MQDLKSILKCPKCWGVFIIFLGFLCTLYGNHCQPIPKVITTPIIAYQPDPQDYAVTCSGENCFTQFPVNCQTDSTATVATITTSGTTQGWSGATTESVPVFNSGGFTPSPTVTPPQPDEYPCKNPPWPLRYWPYHTPCGVTP